ncbi:Ecr family regulatory small membrane protein [Enterobacter asburiae]|nr:Ecr family regulatory small membrane protein [Scandinavium sp.]
MSKTEIFLILLILVILIVGIWFIFSDQIWVLVSYLETLIYPDIVTPE